MIWTFDFGSDIPIYLQLRNQVVLGIAQGELVPGEQLPTIRALAEESGINMMTVSKAYQLLKQEGYLTTDRRSGTIVSPRGETAVVPTAMLERLKIVLAELRLTGLSQAKVIELCQRLYPGDDK